MRSLQRSCAADDYCCEPAHVSNSTQQTSTQTGEFVTHGRQEGDSKRDLWGTSTGGCAPQSLSCKAPFVAGAHMQVVRAVSLKR